MAFVYFIGDEHDRVKIGVSRKNGRLRQLQVGNADLLTEIGEIEFSDVAFTIEAQLHRALVQFWVERERKVFKEEWFDHGHAVVNGVIDYWTYFMEHGDFDLSLSVYVNQRIPNTVAARMIQEQEDWTDLIIRFRDFKKRFEPFLNTEVAVNEK